MIAVDCNEVSNRLRMAKEFASLPGAGIEPGLGSWRAAHPEIPVRIRVTAAAPMAPQQVLMTRVLFGIAQFG